MCASLLVKYTHIDTDRTLDFKPVLTNEADLRVNATETRQLSRSPSLQLGGIDVVIQRRPGRLLTVQVSL